MDEDILKIGGAIGTIALLIIGIASIRSCTTPTPDDGIPYETIQDDDKLFLPGEHIIAVGIEDPIGEYKTYEGHAGYKPVGISCAKYGDELITHYHSGYMLFENVVDVKARATGTDEKGNYVYNNFGTPVEYEIGALDENSYAAYQHIVSIPYDSVGPRTQIKYFDGYDVVGIANAARGETIGYNCGGCILYVNTEPVEYTYDPESNTYFGTPIEKQKVLEK